MKDPQQLIKDYLDDALNETDVADFNAWLKADTTNMREFTQALAFEQQIRAAAQARAARPSILSPIPLNSTRPSYLARAAAWVGAFTIFGKNAAQAASPHVSSPLAKAATLVSKATLPTIMTKTTIAITTTILLVGGTAIFLIQHNNQTASARIDALSTEADALRSKLGLSSAGTATGRSSISAASTPSAAMNIAAMIVLYEKKSHSFEEGIAMKEFQEALAAMDAASIKNLVLDAEKIGGAPSRLLEELLNALTAKSPAEAAFLATRLAASAKQFDWLVSFCAEKAFKAWMAADPTAADAWYTATAAAGGLESKTIPSNGLEDRSIDRSLARVRFAALLKTNPQAAEAMLSSMLPADVTQALKDTTDPSVVERLLPKLSPDQKGPAAGAAIKDMAAKDLNAAVAWAKTLDLNEPQRDSLLAAAVLAANANAKLDLNGVATWTKSLQLSDQERGTMLRTAAMNSSIIDDKVAWDQVTERTAWLRKEAPPELASKQVGEYLGLLALHRGQVDAAVKAYEHAVAGQATPDPQLSIRFAEYLGMGPTSNCSTEALKILQQLPATPERDEAIKGIEMNRD